jgi:hypothetical protein
MYFISQIFQDCMSHEIKIYDTIKLQVASKYPCMTKTGIHHRIFAFLFFALSACVI